MATNILSDFSLKTTDFRSIRNLPDLAFVNEHFAMVLNTGPHRADFVRLGQLYRLTEGRILWVTEGSADIALTLEEYHITRGDIILLAPESVMELKACSKDYAMMGVIYKENLSVGQNIIIHPAEEDWDETLQFARLLWNVARRTPFRKETVNHLVLAIISDIRHIHYKEQELHPTKKKNRQEETFSNFKRLVNEHCARHRNIRFYADRLSLTPHYLSTLIAKVSGRSVMYWINRATLIQAKVLLKSKDMLVCEVADHLNFPSQSAFGFFFKRETGLSPREYQKAD